MGAEFLVAGRVCRSGNAVRREMEIGEDRASLLRMSGLILRC